MHPEMETLRCAIVRGGTSKAVFIMMNEYPKDPAKRDAVILAVYGSPDVRQIDGLGGADVLTSKHAIISRSSRPDADVDYTFAQVSFESAFVDYAGNCGNISSAVGPFAIDEGLVEPVEPITTVRIRMTNSDKILIAEVPVTGGKAMVDGDFAIDGVPGTGAKIAMDWSDVVGSITGKLMPTGNPTDTIETDGGKYTVSIVDAGNPVVFVLVTALYFGVFGEIYSLFPATQGDTFGAKYAAANAGMLYTAKGVGSLLVPFAAAAAVSMGWHVVFTIAMGFNLLAAALGLFVLKPMRVRHFAAIRAEVENDAIAGGRRPMQPAPGN